MVVGAGGDVDSMLEYRAEDNSGFVTRNGAAREITWCIHQMFDRRNSMK
jgi:hypothetical protein